jgi:hypothetical protein
MPETYALVMFCWPRNYVQAVSACMNRIVLASCSYSAEDCYREEPHVSLCLGSKIGSYDLQLRHPKTKIARSSFRSSFLSSAG